MDQQAKEVPVQVNQKKSSSSSRCQEGTVWSNTSTHSILISIGEVPVVVLTAEPRRHTVWAS